MKSFLKFPFLILLITVICPGLMSGQNPILVQIFPDSILKNETGLIIPDTASITEKVGVISVSETRTIKFWAGMIVSPQEAMQGKIPGMIISSNSGVPGSSFTMQNLRFNSSYNSGAPLVIVDDVVLGNDLESLNINDINTITYYRDASDVAIYGEQASNGALVIETKKGSKDFSVNYSGKMGVSALTKKLDLLTAGEFRELINERYSGNTNVTGLLGSYNTDWQNEIYRTAFGQDHHISVSGSLAKKIPIWVSIGETDLDGIMKTSSYNRTTTYLSANPSFFKDYLKLSINLKGIFNNNRIANDQAIINSVFFDPTQPVYDKNSEYGGYFTYTDFIGTPVSMAPTNPVALLNLTNDRQTKSRFIGNLKVDYKLHFLPDLRIVGIYGKDNFRLNDTTAMDPAGSWTYLYGGGYSRREKYTNNNTEITLYTDYSKEFEPVSGKLDLILGYFSNKESYSYKLHATNLHTPVAVISHSESDGEVNQASFFGRLKYSMLDRYELTFTLRRDGNSKYSETFKNSYFPSASLKWDINKEQFMETFTALSDLKLRIGYGSSGAFQPSHEPDDAIHEKVSSLNIGIDYSLINNRISGSFNFYKCISDNILYAYPVPTGTNLNNFVLLNNGKAVNKGFDFRTDATIASGHNLFWTIGLNGCFNKNKMLFPERTVNYPGSQYGSIAGGIGNNVQILTAGYPAGSFYLFQQIYNSSGKPLEGVYVDINESGSVTSADRRQIKKSYPDWLLGFHSYTEYKDWDFSFSGRLSLGNYVYNNVNSNAGYNYLYNSAGFLRNLPSSANATGFNLPQYFSDYYLQNASFLRMDYISLGYSFNDLRSARVKVRIEATVRNAFVITKYKGQAPEVYNGIDGYTYPRCRTFSVGIDISM